MRLGPEAVPEFAATDIEGTQRRHGRGAILDPTHTRSFQAFADNLAARLRGAATDVPPVLAIGGVVRAIAVVLEVANQLA